MAWSDFINGEILSSVRSKINTAMNELYPTIAKTTVLENGLFVGTAKWNDFYIHGTALVSGPSAPDLTIFQSNIQLYTFDGASTLEETNGVFEVMHDYKEGTDIRPHVHWAPINANTGNVKWQIEYTICNVNGTFPANTTISAIGAASGALKHIATETSAVISGTNIKIGDMLAFRIFRDPADAQDTYGSDAFLLSVGMHYQVDSTGSANTFTKT